jgi:hypothetical protein
MPRPDVSGLGVHCSSSRGTQASPVCTELHPTGLDVQRGCLQGFQALNSLDVSSVAPEATPDCGSRDGVFGTSRANTTGHVQCEPDVHTKCLTKGNGYVFARLKLVIGESGA